LGFCLVLFATICIFHQLQNAAIIAQIFKAAGFTYGPLLGLYGFGMFTRRNVRDGGVLWVCLAAASTSFLLNQMAPTWFRITIGFEILLYNGGLTFLGLWLISQKSDLETA